MVAKRKRVVVRYSGHVQGVGFRMTAVAQSRQLDLHGFVRNQPDGTVLMDVEGTPADLDCLLDRIESAMRGRIDHAQIDERPPRGIETGFRIEY